MKKTITAIMIVLILLIVVAWAAGVRFHPKAIKAHLQKTSYASYCKVDLNTGSCVVGELITQTDNAVVLKIAGGSISFSKDEIE